MKERLCSTIVHIYFWKFICLSIHYFNMKANKTINTFIWLFIWPEKRTNSFCNHNKSERQSPHITDPEFCLPVHCTALLNESLNQRKILSLYLQTFPILLSHYLVNAFENWIKFFLFDSLFAQTIGWLTNKIIEKCQILFKLARLGINIFIKVNLKHY